MIKASRIKAENPSWQEQVASNQDLSWGFCNLNVLRTMMIYQFSVCSDELFCMCLHGASQLKRIGPVDVIF